jgi:Mitochondrial ATPase inhibitor, IATP
MMSGKTSDQNSAGAIRAAGDGFSKMEVAHEEEFFYKLVSAI